MNTFEKMLPLVLLAVIGAAATSVYRSTSEEHAQQDHAAQSAGFTDRDAMKQAVTNSIGQLSDQDRQQREDKTEADRIAAKKARDEQEAAAIREKSRIEEEARANDPTNKMKLSAVHWTKSGFGSIALVSVTIENANLYAVKDFTISCDMVAGSGTRLGTSDNVVYETVKPASRRTIRDINFGLIHSQTQSLACGLMRASRQ